MSKIEKLIRKASCFTLSIGDDSHLTSFGEYMDYQSILDHYSKPVLPDDLMTYEECKSKVEALNKEYPRNYKPELRFHVSQIGKVKVNLRDI